MAAKKHAQDLNPAIISLHGLPSLIGNAGDDAVRRFIEFFAANIRNRNTRQAYARAIRDFFDFCEANGRDLYHIEPVIIAAYIESHTGSPQTIKQALSAIKRLFDFMVVGQIIPFNPASSVRGPKHVVKRGKTPILSTEETRALLESIDTSSIIGFRDRALIGLMFYSFGRVSAILGMNTDDIFRKKGRLWIRLHEKGGKYHEVPLHSEAMRYLDDYIEKAGLLKKAKEPLFRTMRGTRKTLSPTRLQRTEALLMVKRRARACGLPETTRCHTFRATGLTNYLVNDGKLEVAQEIAGHESVRTTKLYDRREEIVTAEEIERIKL